MIKILYAATILLSVTSCSFISYSQVIPALKTSIFGVPDQRITKEIFDSIEYSFIKVKYGKTSIAILPLAGINNDVYKWVSKSNEVLYTLKGKIIKAENSTFDFSILNASQFILDQDHNDEIFNFNLILEDPFAVIEQTAYISKIEEGDYNNELIASNIAHYYEEKVVTNGFKWKFINKYWTDERANVVRSIQSVHPNASDLEIEFYYKY